MSLTIRKGIVNNNQEFDLLPPNDVMPYILNEKNVTYKEKTGFYVRSDTPGGSMNSNGNYVGVFQSHPNMWTMEVDVIPGYDYNIIAYPRDDAYIMLTDSSSSILYATNDNTVISKGFVLHASSYPTAVKLYIPTDITIFSKEDVSISALKEPNLTILNNTVNILSKNSIKIVTGWITGSLTIEKYGNLMIIPLKRYYNAGTGNVYSPNFYIDYDFYQRTICGFFDEYTVTEDGLLKTAIISDETRHTIGPVDSEYTEDFNNVEIPESANYIFFGIYYPNETNIRLPNYISINEQLVFIKDDNFVTSSELGQYVEESDLEDYAKKSDIPGYSRMICPQLMFPGKYYHFSFDDVRIWESLISLSSSASIFDIPYFSRIKSVHDATGCVFTLNLFGCNAGTGGTPTATLSDVPDIWKDEFYANRNWLKFSHHSYYTDQQYGTPVSGHSLLQDYTYFCQQVIRFTGSAECIDRHIRLGYFNCPSVQEALSIHNIANGVVLYSTSDDTRSSNMYLTLSEINKINTYGMLYDQENGMMFIRSMPRLDNDAEFDHTRIMNNINAHVATHKLVEFFLHAITDFSQTKTEESIELFTWLNSLGYKPAFFSDIVYS